MPWMQASTAMPCPICGKNHYCTMKPEAGIVKCTQVMDGSFGSRRDAAGIGYFHRHDFEGEFKEPVIKRKKSVTNSDWGDVLKVAATAPRRHFEALARSFGCDISDLHRWGVGWLSHKQCEAAGTTCNTHGVWTFPMRDASGEVIGIRLRNEYGSKYAMVGSSNGLFFKPPITPSMPLLVVDGASDALVGWRRDLNVVGRPSSTSGHELLTELLQRVNPTWVDQLLDREVNAEADPPREAALELLRSCPAGTIFYPPKPHKDLRQWLKEMISLPNRLSRSAHICGSTVNSSPS